MRTFICLILMMLFATTAYGKQRLYLGQPERCEVNWHCIEIRNLTKSTALTVTLNHRKRYTVYANSTVWIIYRYGYGIEVDTREDLNLYSLVDHRREKSPTAAGSTWVLDYNNP